MRSPRWNETVPGWQIAGCGFAGVGCDVGLLRTVDAEKEGWYQSPLYRVYSVGREDIPQAHLRGLPCISFSSGKSPPDGRFADSRGSLDETKQ